MQLEEVHSILADLCLLFHSYNFPEPRLNFDAGQFSLKFLEPSLLKFHQADSLSVEIPLPNEVTDFPPLVDLVLSPCGLNEGHRAQDLHLCGRLLGLLFLVVHVEFSKVLLFHRLNGVVPGGARSCKIHLRVVAAGQVHI